MIYERCGSVESDNFARWNYHGHSNYVIPGYMTSYAYSGDVLRELHFFFRGKNTFLSLARKENKNADNTKVYE